ncbi:hypothetical protein SKC35_00715 [Aquirufa sp. KTFRIE-69F]|uniref:EF-hand domain-containing protein n=1 Tax=Aquirufa originis TaxID=3096514 RepID=A0ABW6D4P1_9BACT
MIGLNTFNEEELEILNTKFQNFSKELKKLILESNLFYDESSIREDGFRHLFRSISKSKYTNLDIKWYDDFESININITTKKIVKKSIWGTEYEYGLDFYYPVFIYDSKYKSLKEKSDIVNLNNNLNSGLYNLNEVEIVLLNNINEMFHSLISEVKNDYKVKTIQHFENINTSILEVDKDNNGEVDLIDGESFNKLLNKHQKFITEIDKNYIQKFVKISMYLKTKKKNTQNIFLSISQTRNEKELDELMSLLKNQIHTYELLVFHSLSMITSLVESDLITFYEIYESFDQVGVFNSNWENEVSNKLSDIGDGIKDLMYSINRMENNIILSLDNLTYSTQESFGVLNNSITSQLKSIDSSINFNNLLTGIQTYQMYKINQNTKRIN